MADEALYARFAAAYMRGHRPEVLPEALAQKPLEDLSPDELAEIVGLGRDAGLRLHRFKRTMGLARVQKVLGVSRGLAPVSLLDIGSGRGAFLWPLLDTFPGLSVTATDLLDHRVRDLEAVRDGGVANLGVRKLDATRMPFEDQSFDGVTMLEVLEHIPDARQALAEAVRVSGRFVVLSVPSQPDDNPEHIHLFSEKTIREMFAAAGVRRVNVEYVLNHMIAVATR